jgi:hypothetical protein
VIRRSRIRPRAAAIATSTPLAKNQIVTLANRLIGSMATRPLLLSARMNPRQLYRMRAPASGREALAHAEPGEVYLDRETGEEMEPVAMVLPLAPSASALPRSPENLRACRRCDQLIGLDVSDCPYCGLRQSAL